MKVAAGELDQAEEIAAILQDATASAGDDAAFRPVASRMPGQVTGCYAGIEPTRTQEGPDRLNVSVANEIPGSLTGSQRPQPHGYGGPRPAVIIPAERHVGPLLTTSGDVAGMPPKQ